MSPTRWVLGLVGLAILVTFLPARSAAEKPIENPRARIGLVFDVGGRGDKSFNDAAYLGVLRAESELRVAVSYLEPSSTEDREAALRLFAARKLDLVIGVGFIFSSDIDAVARAYPEVHFAGVDYAPSATGIPPNVAALAFREEEGSFLVGAVAGLMSKTGHVGFVGGMAGPLISKFEAGFFAGVEASCAKCTIHSAYAGTTPDAFRDPAQGKALANAQIAAGSDILYHASGSTGHGVFEAAKDAHIKAIGVDSDQYDEMPGVVVTSMIKRADIAVFETIRAVVEGRFKGGLQVFGLADQGVDYIHEGPHAEDIPDDVKAKVELLRADVLAGKIHVPKTR